MFFSLPAMADKKYVSAIVPKNSVKSEEHKQEVISFATELGKVIKENWYPKEYKGNFRSIVKISFNIDDSYSLTVSESSGDASFDNSAKSAVERSIPNHYPHKDVALEYVFYYKNTSFFSRIPVLPSILRLPARLGAGYVAHRLGMNEFILINL